MTPTTNLILLNVHHVDPMMEAVDKMYLMMWMWLGMKAALLIVLIYFVLRVRALMNRISVLSDKVEMSEANADNDREISKTILATIKAWTQVNDSTNDTTRRAVESNAGDIKTVLAALPAVAADVVVAKIEEKVASPDSGIRKMPITPPPTKAG